MGDIWGLIGGGGEDPIGGYGSEDWGNCEKTDIDGDVDEEEEEPGSGCEYG